MQGCRSGRERVWRVGCNVLFFAPEAFRKHQASGHSNTQYFVSTFVLKIDHRNVMKSESQKLENLCIIKTVWC